MQLGDGRLPAHFWAKVAEDPETLCWEWMASRLPAGYGRFAVNRKMTTAHRVSYAAVHGPIPAGLDVDHMCHNRSCVNPMHLRAVTKKQNQENQISVRGKSPFRGVSWSEHHGKWHAKVSHNGKTIYCGAYAHEEDAALAAAAKRNELYTHNDSDRG